MSENTENTENLEAVSDEEVKAPKKSEKSQVALLEEEGDVAADYLEALLDIADLDHVIIWRSTWTVEQLVQMGGRTGRHGPGSLTLLQFNDHSYSTSKDVDIATLIE